MSSFHVQIVVFALIYHEHTGPSTIVGSAAFNLLVILSICIMAVKEFKKIREVEGDSN